MKEPNLSIEVTQASPSGLDFFCIGVDEVGRGCLAGPVVAAAVGMSLKQALSLGFSRLGEPEDRLGLGLQIQDSKKIKEPKRHELSSWIRERAIFAINEGSVPEIGELNILHASLLAMQRAVQEVEEKAGRIADLVLVDGNKIPKGLRGKRVLSVVKGDQKSFMIAMASIVAKVYRDDLMKSLDSSYPGYGLSIHKGYPTPMHKDAIQRLGIQKGLHRPGFKM